MAIILDIKVIPSSGKQHLEQNSSGKIKCYLKSPPEKGKANTELIKFFSKKLSLPQHCVSILKGATSRNKTIKIESENDQQHVFSQLGLETQLTI